MAIGTASSGMARRLECPRDKIRVAAAMQAKAMQPNGGIGSTKPNVVSTGIRSIHPINGIVAQAKTAAMHHPATVRPGCLIVETGSSCIEVSMLSGKYMPILYYYLAHWRIY
ncbi:hypothetical protein [Sphingomonas sp. BK481]|uniref:hypothetical protein n=1 Tax=Sphingomonas sp. BK481 TaxID=2586981 RepID=UPI00162254C7|nr:hypothetical protein [Sphingomonas sp. BK481]MBB3586290.1 hypothetical protein [Sphingomonas sp. BK481]